MLQMSLFHFSCKLLLAASLIGFAKAYPSKHAVRDVSLLPSNTLSSNKGWADAEWTFQLPNNLTIIHYNGGPCANGDMLSNYTYTNGTQANATFLDVYRDLDAAFSTVAGGKQATAQLLASWQSVAALSGGTNRLSMISPLSDSALSRRMVPEQQPNRGNAVVDLAIATAGILIGSGLAFGLLQVAQVQSSAHGVHAYSNRNMLGALALFLGLVTGLMVGAIRNARLAGPRDAAQAAILLQPIRDAIQHIQMLRTRLRTPDTESAADIEMGYFPLEGTGGTFEVGPEDTVDDAYAALLNGEIDSDNLEPLLPRGYRSSDDLFHDVDLERGKYCPVTA